jgi:hypothetical protein
VFGEFIGFPPKRDIDLMLRVVSVSKNPYIMSTKVKRVAIAARRIFEERVHTPK